MTNTRHTDAAQPWDIAKAIALYDSGKTFRFIGEVFGCCQSTVIYRLKKADHFYPRIHPPYATPEERREAERDRNRRCRQNNKANAAYNPEQCREQSRIRNRKYRLGLSYQAKAKERCEASKQWFRQLRLEAIQTYGGACVCCGEDKACFLTIDHVHNDGAQHRKQVGSGGAFYLWLRKQHYPDDGRFQVLCFNCNFSKAMDPVGHRLAHANAIHIDGLGDHPMSARTRS